MKKIIFLVALIGAFSIKAFSQTTLTPVDAGSKAHFVIKNFGFHTGGDFKGLKGTIRFDPSNPTSSNFDVTVDAATIDTDNDTRDGHLKKSEYFDVEKYKTLRFKSTQVTKSGKGYMMKGNLTIKGVTKSYSFPFTAVTKNDGYVFDGSFEINRRDFNVGGSSISMSDNLKIALTVFAKK